jgi:hypothetical protein
MNSNNNKKINLEIALVEPKKSLKFLNLTCRSKIQGKFQEKLNQELSRINVSDFHNV